MKSRNLYIIRYILIHFVFWIGIWFLFFYFFNYNSTDREYVIWFSSLLLPLTMALTYFAIYFLIPRYLLTKKYKHFALYSFYTLLVSSYFMVLVIYGCLFILKKMDASNIPPMMKNFVFILILVYMVVGMVSFVSILSSNFNTQKKNKELQNKILNTQLQIKEQELQYLKNQIHPHFLFNTLNTIYGFALKQSKETPDIILKLSNLLDYILYQVNKPSVALKDEITHIREYIELEKIRFQESLKVNFHTDEIDRSIQISPMLMIPFVENAFKHGGLIDGFLYIDIKISMQNSNLNFSIKNSLSEGKKSSSKNGIGLQNIRKRLDLNFKNKYDLNIKNDNSYFKVELVINNMADYKNE